MPPMHNKWKLVRFDTASVSPTTPSPTPMPGPPYDSSPLVILAAVLGSLAFGIGVLWLARCAFADPLLRQARRTDPNSWYILRLSPAPPGLTKRCRASTVRIPNIKRISVLRSTNNASTWTRHLRPTYPSRALLPGGSWYGRPREIAFETHRAIR
ncbi:uncharacterized protein B0H64DRAFT_206085 [Chaetomium fimeti]|uniref:Uncharacterized protein n=1 Tax=Chaetomium fimeti TaxID=1854472 RepID=A0AAE0LPX6_9PEZI|nr:hypothetical protein B0H64DRAFT_206085 [Chaetomium fimeti]